MCFVTDEGARSGDMHIFIVIASLMGGRAL